MRNLNRTYVYIVRCADQSLYCGWTKDLQRRLVEHNEGIKGAKYTRSRRPVILVYEKEFTNAVTAQAEERRIKRMTRQEKLFLLTNPK